MIEFDNEFKDLACVEYFLHHFMQKIEYMLLNLNNEHLIQLKENCLEHLQTNYL